jgi:hypothetical protein
VIVRRLQYRFRQGLVRLGAALWPGRIDRAAARAVLSEAGWQLFSTADPGDQQHGLCVLGYLHREGEVTPALEEAALLHDVGKSGMGLSLPYRTAIVLLRATGQLERWASDEPGSWRFPFHMQLHHAERGAALCAAAGCDARTVALVRWHETAPDLVPDTSLGIELARLQSADDAC